ncbi:ComEA family DNA-binding protein [Cetobacterium sp. SF1]|uniref:ComEA family DNA-binding protein n=1 Tax=unclassified Cetobacterium TaxID=2630983 RepID=UPI003CFA465A
MILGSLLYCKNDEFKIIMSPNLKEEKNLKLDINTSTKEEMLRRGIAISYVNKIIEYREITGGFLSTEELTRISGIGEKTKNKLEKNFIIGTLPTLKKMNINTSDIKDFIYYGFTKKEIQNIVKYKRDHSRIKSNIELKDILSKDRYQKYKNLINY